MKNQFQSPNITYTQPLAVINIKMTFPDKKKEYINKKGFQLVELIKELNQQKEMPNVEKGSIENTIPIDLSKNITSEYVIESEDFFGKSISRKVTTENNSFGFDRESYIEFDKFISNIIKDISINSLVSRDFVDNVVFKWIIKTYENKKANSNLSDKLLDEINGSIKYYKISYPIYYLDIGKYFKIGPVEFGFFPKEFFDKKSNQFNEKNSENKENYYELLRKDFQGKVFCSYIVNAEKEKAKEIALSNCSFAVDILKICSDTIDFPLAKLSFDIDNRTRENISNQVIVQEAPTFDDFSISLYRLPSHHRIYSNEWEIIKKRNLEIFSLFFNQICSNQNTTELEKLLKNAIERLANALSNNNKHQRIVELFTILESLLLRDEELPIIESVTKYCSKIVFKEPDDRKNVIKMLKYMYSIRSANIHHGKNSEFQIEDLRKLQLVVKHTIIELILRTKNHNSKISILDEIDDAILRAY